MLAHKSILTYESRLEKISPRLPTGKESWRNQNEIYTSVVDLEDLCCTQPDVRAERGIFVCFNCGTVHETVLDSTPRHAFTVEEVRNRKMHEPVYSPIGPRTVIRRMCDVRGVRLGAEVKAKFLRLAKINRSLLTTFERNLWIAIPTMKGFQESLGLPEKVMNDVYRIYTTAVRQKLTMGRSIDTLLAASIFAATRIHDIPRTLKEIVEMTHSNKHDIARSFRLISMKILPQLKLRPQHFSTERYIDKFTEELGISMTVRNVAMQIYQLAQRNGYFIVGKDPRGLASAVIYLAGLDRKEKRTQKEISIHARITEVTLRMRVRELKKNLAGSGFQGDLKI